MKRIYVCLVFIIAVFISWEPAFAQTAATWIEKGNILEETETYTEAVEAYTKAIEYDPGCADAYLKRGTAVLAQ